MWKILKNSVEPNCGEFWFGIVPSLVPAAALIWANFLKISIFDSAISARVSVRTNAQAFETRPHFPVHHNTQQHELTNVEKNFENDFWSKH
jgi:hypothetical protein